MGEQNWGNGCAVSFARPRKYSLLSHCSISWLNLLPARPDLELRNPMRPLPIMPMIRKRLKFRLRNPRINPHLQNNRSRHILRERANRTGQARSICGQLPYLKTEHDLLSIYRAEISPNRLSSERLVIQELLSCAIAVNDLDLFFFDDQIAAIRGSSDFSTVGAMAKVTSFLRPEFRVDDSDRNRSTKA